MLILAASIIAAFATCAQGTPLPVYGRIVNGTDVPIKDLPYMVSLQYNGGHICGASIIDEYNVLTAAHCSASDVTLFSVIYGSTALFGSSNIIRVERMITHDEFNGQIPGYNDIALVHLCSPLPFGERVAPIRLPPRYSATPAEASAVLSGWGANKTGGDLKTVLQRVDLKVFSDDECEWLHRETGPTSRLFQICAGVPEGGKGQCSGDSGGPLVVNGVQVGIVSWSVKPCAAQGYPGVFTKVSSYTDWIDTHRKRLLRNLK